MSPRALTTPHQGHRQAVLAQDERTNAACDCEFCSRIADEQRPWYDWAVVQHEAGFFEIAPLGSLVAGYVLLLPERHCSSFAELTAGEYRIAVAQMDGIQQRYRAAGLFDFSYFEHGCRTGQTASGCIDHAHWHVLPFEFGLPTIGPSWRAVAGFDAVRDSVRDKDDALDHYLYLHNSTGSYVSYEVPTRQFLRQQLALQVQRPDEWDYLLFPQLECLRKTIDLFKA